MLKKVRRFLKNNSPDWLNTEVNKNLLQNLSANIKSTPKTKDINSAPLIKGGWGDRERDKTEDNLLPSPFRRGAGGEVNINPVTNNDRQFSTTDSSLFPTPGTPHWRRIRQVFQALDNAPQFASYNQLIEYVRETTGKGCSRKLISKWKKQRNSYQSSVSSHQLGFTKDETDNNGLEKTSNIISSSLAIALDGIFQSPTTSNDPSSVNDLHLPQTSKKTTFNNSLMTDDCSLMTVKSWSLMTVMAGITIALVGCELLPFNNDRPNEKLPLASATAPLNPLPAIPERRKNRLEPRNIKIELTLSNPQDLKVKPGDKISAGQVLSDRLGERNRLQAKKKQLQLSLEKLNLPLTSIPKPKPIPKISPLPPVSYAEEEAAIKLKQQKLTEAKRAIALQQKKIDSLKQLNSSSEVPPLSRGVRGDLKQGSTPNLKLILEHERANLKNLEAARQSALIQLEVQESKLTTAKEQRAYIEYQRQLEQTRRAIAIEQRNQAIASQESERERLLAEREYSQAQIETQIQTLDYQIEQLSTVRAPYEGTIKKVKWTGQSDHNLTAVVTLSVNSKQSSVISESESVNGDTRTVKTERPAKQNPSESASNIITTDR